MFARRTLGLSALLLRGGSSACSQAQFMSLEQAGLCLAGLRAPG